jgi:hypothetical protein
MIIDENNNDKLKRKDNWKFDFPFRTEKIIHSLPLAAMRKTNTHKDQNLIVKSAEEAVEDSQSLFIRKSKSKASSTPTPITPITTSTAKHDYTDPTVYYVSRDFFAATNDHLSVFMDDELELLEELPGGTWTRVKERDSQQIGLIPTEILESGPERLAKENKSSNQDSIRVLSCQPSSTSTSKSLRKSKKTVSFCEKLPEIVHYPADDTNDHSIFPFTLNDEISQAIAFSDATSYDILSGDFDNFSIDNEPPALSPRAAAALAVERSDGGFFKKLFKRKPKEKFQILESLHDFEKYPDHLIRVYTGNFDVLLNGYKTFIVDESLTFDEFTQMVISTFDLDADGFFYELNLVNHLTAEVVPLALDFTIEQVIELTKREGLAFSSRMPRQIRKAQKDALKKLKINQESGERDKSTDYVTPFKFVLNRIFTSSENVPIFVHVSLAYNLTENFESSNSSANLIISSLFPEGPPITMTNSETPKKWYQKLLKDKSKSNENHPLQSLHRLQIFSNEPLHNLIHNLLSSLNVPETLPGIAFEAFLPAIHDAIELPLPINMPIGEVMKIRPKLDQSQQVIIIRPVLI